MGGYCGKCRGMMMLFLGALVLLNVYWVKVDWAVAIGALLILGGIVRMVKSSCGCAGCCAEGACGPVGSDKGAVAKKKR